MSGVRITLRVLGEPVSAAVPTPPARVPLTAVLPLLRQLDDGATAVAARQAEAARGAAVTCAKGCSACCRAQPVPVTPVEAAALAQLVAALPEPRRTQVRATFAANVAALRAAGLADVYLSPTRDLTRDAARDVARRYFALGLVCPFLVDDACGIYPDRPFVCRQYLVTSDPALCANPFDNAVAPIPAPIAFAHAMLATEEQFAGGPRYTVPLALALEYAAAHAEEQSREYDAEPLFRAAVAALG